MVMRVLVLAPLLAGCLYKPDPPATASDGSIDTPGGPCAGGAVPFPADLDLERSVRIADINGDTREDVIVYGRSQLAPRIYILYGRAEMNLACADVVLTPPDGDLLDVWVGHVNADQDAYVDLATLSKHDDTLTLQLRLGDQTGFVVSGTTTDLADAHGWLPAAWGRPDERVPMFIALVMEDPAQRELVFGSYQQPFGSAAVSDSHSLAAIRVVGDATASGAAFTSAASSANPLFSEGVWANPFATARDRLAIIGSDQHLYTVRHEDTDATQSRFTLAEHGVLGAPSSRTVRTWQRRFSLDQTLTATEGDGGLLILGFAAGLVSKHLPAPADVANGYVHKDFAFGQLDAQTNDPVDVVSLAAEPLGPLRRLNVHLDLDVTTPDVSERDQLHLALSAGESLAIGDFDGTSDTPDQILVLGAVTDGQIGRCVQVIPDSSPPCLGACGTATCL